MVSATICPAEAFSLIHISYSDFLIFPCRVTRVSKEAIGEPAVVLGSIDVGSCDDGLFVV